MLDTLTTEKYELDSRQVYEFFLPLRVYTGSRAPHILLCVRDQDLFPRFKAARTCG